MSPLHFQKVQVSDVETLSALCSSIYDEHYLHLWYDQGEWYKTNAYGIVRLQQELLNPNAVYYFVMLADDLAGYLKINYTVTYPKMEAYDCLEIERIYFGSVYQGQGLGRQVLKFALDIAKAMNKHYVVLKSMDSSPANHFYEAMGFEKFDTSRLTFEQLKPELRGMFHWRYNLAQTHD